MTLPGDRLRAMAARRCSTRTMERLVDPVLTDIRVESARAISQGRVWRSRWIRLAGSVALFKVVVLYGCERALRGWSDDSGRTFGRTVGLSSVAIGAATVLLCLPVVIRGASPEEMLYLVPQALPLAIPIGITAGIFWGLGGRSVSFLVQGAALAMALACSAGSLTTMAWVVPSAGQAWRASIAEEVRRTTGTEATLMKGLTEMTLGELRGRIDSLTHAGRASEVRNVVFAYHLRFALPCASFVLALFVLAVMPRRPVRRWVLAASACGVCLSYFLVLFAGAFAVRTGALPSIAGAWLPNLVFIGASMGLLTTAGRRGALAQA